MTSFVSVINTLQPLVPVGIDGFMRGDLVKSIRQCSLESALHIELMLSVCGDNILYHNTKVSNTEKSERQRRSSMVKTLLSPFILSTWIYYPLPVISFVSNKAL